MKAAKKVVSLILVVLIMLSIVTACQSSDANGGKDAVAEKSTAVEKSTAAENSTAGEQKTEQLTWDGGKIRYAAWWDVFPWKNYYGQKSYDAMNEIQKRQYDYFSSLEKKYNCEFEAVNMELNSYMSKIAASSMAGEPLAEILKLDPTYVHRLVKQGSLTPMDQYIKADPKRWNESYSKIMTIGDHVYALCSNFNYKETVAGISALKLACYMNRKLVKDAGYSDKDIQNMALEGKWTWDKMIEIAQKCKKDVDSDGKTDIYGFKICFPEDMPLLNNAVYFKDINGKRISQITQPDFIEALTLVANAYKDGVLAPGITATSDKLFDQGKAAFILSQTFMLAQYRAALGTNFAILPMPSMPKASGYCDSAPPANGVGMLASLPEEKKKVIAQIITDYETGLYIGMDKETLDKVSRDIREDWLINKASSAEDVKIAEMMQLKYPTQFNMYQAPKDSSKVRSAIADAIMGNKTPTEALEAVNPAYQASIDETFGQ